VKVAPDYEKVVGAIQIRLARILAAQADAIKTNALAERRPRPAQPGNGRPRLAGNQRARERALFTNQITGRLKPRRPFMRSGLILQTFARATANARKYVLLTTNTQDVIVFDLQDKVREDLLNLSVTPPKTK